MQGISYDYSPIRDHAFFKKSEFEFHFGNELVQLTSFTMKRSYLARKPNGLYHLPAAACQPQETPSTIYKKYFGQYLHADKV